MSGHVSLRPITYTGNIIFSFWFHNWHNSGLSFLLCLLNFFFVDLLFTLLSDGRILKASTLTNPCKLLQEWDMKTNPDGKSRLSFTKSPRFLSLTEPFYSYKIQQ